MKKIFLFLLVSTSLWSQQKIDISYEARYELKFKEYSNHQGDLPINNFILLFNNSESVIKNMNNYVKDSLINNGKIKYTGDAFKDASIDMNYTIEFPYIIYTKGNQINFSNELAYAGELKYSETVDFKWKIIKESKNINGIKCIKATTTKWGRKWIAYYSPNHVMPFGPYKFHGLPGLIFEVSDEKKEYNFTLYKFKKRKQKNVIFNSYSKAKKITKQQYEKARHNSAIRPFEGKVEGDPSIGKRITKKRIDKEKNYNPIELTD